MNHIRILCTLCVLAWSCSAVFVHGQEYPNKSVRIMVGYTPGGSADIAARAAAQGLSALWGQAVVVDNRPGASATIAADLVAKAQPDGYTLLLGEVSAIAAAGSLYPQLPYDPNKDLTGITRLITFPLIVVVLSSSSITSIQELVAQARAKPGMLRYSSVGVGTPPHLFLERMNHLAGIKTEAIQYKGSAPALTALLAGDVDYTIVALSTILPHMKAGTVRAIAITSAAPLPALPNVPSIGSVVPGYDAIVWHGLQAPAKTPAPVIAKIYRDVVTAMQVPGVKEHLEGLGMQLSLSSSPAEYTRYVEDQTAMWSAVIRTSNIQAN